LGRAKAAMMNIEDNQDLVDFLKTLLEQELFTDALAGIAKQATSKGIESLSERQRDVVDKFIENYKNRNVCEKCSNGNVSSLSDYIRMSEIGLCPMCEYDKERLMEE
jgi:FixJ family two-component response regulator